MRKRGFFVGLPRKHKNARRKSEKPKTPMIQLKRVLKRNRECAQDHRNLLEHYRTRCILLVIKQSASNEKVSKRESAHVHGCALLIIKTILSRRPKDLRRSSAFLEHAAAARSSPAIAKFFSGRDPRYTSWKIGRRTDPAYYAELDLISVLRRIAEAKSDDYFGSEHFLKPVKRKWVLYTLVLF